MKRTLASLLALVLMIGLLPAQLTLRLTSLPTHFNPLLDTLHVAGTFNNWDPGDGNYVLTRQIDGSYTVQIPGNAGDAVEYKYTRGDWGRVETQSDDSFQPNRTLTYDPNLVVDDQVARWADFPGIHTIAGDLRVLDSNFPLPQFNTLRRIWIYLPPGYDTSTLSYPVLYMLDGQNLFDVATTAFGTEWAVDESMENIIGNGGQQAIVVGMDHGDAARINEYTPWSNPNYGGGAGENSLDFVVNELKPYIDLHFRTVPGRMHTAIAGSSLGGWMAMYMALERPDIFSKAGVFSPSFWYSDSCYQHASAQGHQFPMRIAMVAGDQESNSMVPDMYRMRDTLLANGFSNAELSVTNHFDGQHSEWYWAREFPAVYNWLWDGLAVGTAVPADGWQVRAAGSHALRLQGPAGGRVQLTLFDLKGQMLFAAEHEAGSLVQVPQFAQGLYIVRLTDGQFAYQQKLFLGE